MIAPAACSCRCHLPTHSAVGNGKTAGTARVLLLGDFVAFRPFGKSGERNLERNGKSPHGAPRGILAAALEVRDPGRM